MLVVGLLDLGGGGVEGGRGRALCSSLPRRIWEEAAPERLVLDVGPPICKKEKEMARDGSTRSSTSGEAGVTRSGVPGLLTGRCGGGRGGGEKSEQRDSEFT
ncbi:hypothetical protein E2562_012895 [Oryza meyeriana var. granulata]|uniref:Uncharacterized protein n=1 Tax=Oryza meyeriana var. granulata TaxID=110450 RepID=A0A6G1CG61_9ORYZ|nr:hypothetical protein E2562_012895 [Oryza meyeriana var. granulata]